MTAVGIAGASSVLHGVARISRNDRLASSALYVGAAAELVSAEARDELPWLFGASAAASAGAAALLVTPPEAAGPGRRTATLGAAAELATASAMRRRLGFVGEVYDHGPAGRLMRVSHSCSATGALLLAARGRRSRTAAVVGSALVLTGGLALRWSVFRAGFQSARDPRYTVVPQKQRLANRQQAA